MAAIRRNPFPKEFVIENYGIKHDPPGTTMRFAYDPPDQTVIYTIRQETDGFDPIAIIEMGMPILAEHLNRPLDPAELAKSLAENPPLT
jgi:hypothetical protein